MIAKKKKTRKKKTVRRAKKTTPSAPATPAGKSKKKKLPCDLPVEFLERIKDAVVFLQQGREPNTSIRSFVEDACRRQIEFVAKKYAKGGEIPSRGVARPRQGRPMGQPTS